MVVINLWCRTRESCGRYFFSAANLSRQHVTDCWWGRFWYPLLISKSPSTLHSWPFCLSSAQVSGEARRVKNGAETARNRFLTARLCRSFVHARAFYPLAKQTACVSVYVVALEVKAHTSQRPDRLGVLLLPLDGMLVRRWVAPSSMSPVPIYTPGWRETKWSKALCLRERRDGRTWARLKPRTSRTRVRGVNHSVTDASTSLGRPRIIICKNLLNLNVT